MKNNYINSSVETETKEKVEAKEKKENLNNIILWNDDFNTFDFVIETLVEVCEHDIIQAEQCTYLIHYKGKCAVKQGTYKKLQPIKEELIRRGLTATIE
jgi:ATP-dependent Clp protease adaptor protein ClpS